MIRSDKEIAMLCLTAIAVMAMIMISADAKEICLTIAGAIGGFVAGQSMGGDKESITMKKEGHPDKPEGGP